MAPATPGPAAPAQLTIDLEGNHLHVLSIGQADTAISTALFAPRSPRSSSATWPTTAST